MDHFGVLVLSPERGVRASPLVFAVDLWEASMWRAMRQRSFEKPEGMKRRSEICQRSHREWNGESSDRCERVDDTKGDSSGFRGTFT